MRKIITALALGTVILILAGTTVSGDIFGDYDHKPIPTCSYCHIYKGFSIGSYNGDDSCGNCHAIKDSIANIEAAHSNICDKCHAIPNNDEQYHNIHKSVDCERCHGSGILPVKPPTGITNCDACHGIIFSGGGGSIHLNHKSRLEEICTRCHGTRPSSNPSGIELKSTISGSDSEKMSIVNEIDKVNKKVYAKVIDYKRYTLYEIFKLMFTIFQ